MTFLARKIAIVTVVVTTLGGCAQTKEWMSSLGNSRSSSDEARILGAPTAEFYLDELYRFSTGDPATQAEIFADAESGFRLAPRLQTNLRFGLILATPGHAESDPEQAQTILRELLKQESLLTPAEVSLATIYLESAEEQIVLNTEAKRLRTSSSRTARSEAASGEQRLATVEAENQRLREELDDAEAKLEAISSIERSIRAQDP
jgi:hypothetical protein